jgi:hypothetical protein
MEAYRHADDVAIAPEFNADGQVNVCGAGR